MDDHSKDSLKQLPSIVNVRGCDYLVRTSHEGDVVLSFLPGDGVEWNFYVNPKDVGTLIEGLKSALASLTSEDQTYRNDLN